MSDIYELRLYDMTLLSFELLSDPAAGYSATIKWAGEPRGIST